MAIVADDPARFPIAVLGEGGQAEWTPARADAFATGGGRRVLFVCSTQVETAHPFAALARAGVPMKLVSAGTSAIWWTTASSPPCGRRGRGSSAKRGSPRLREG